MVFWIILVVLMAFFVMFNARSSLKSDPDDKKMIEMIKRRTRSDELRQEISKCKDVEKQKELVLENFKGRDNKGLRITDGVIIGVICQERFVVQSASDSLKVLCYACARRMINHCYSDAELEPHRQGEYTVSGLSAADYAHMKLKTIHMSQMVMKHRGRRFINENIPYEAPVPICDYCQK